VATVILVRHGRTRANTGGVLAGATPGVSLDDTGRAQAERLAARLSELTLAAVVSSPLERCRQTAEVIAAGQSSRPDIRIEDRLTEIGYGDWTGRPLSELSADPAWSTVQHYPSAVRFPGAGGETLRAAQTRAVDAIRDWDAAMVDLRGAAVIWVACSHGDVIKAVIADAVGMHLDLFQRIVVDPAGLSVIRYTQMRPYLLRLNDTGAVSDLVPAGQAGPDAVVGGGAGGP
jgi:probable phosphomutase (TIGR03848 family)